MQWEEGGCILLGQMISTCLCCAYMWGGGGQHPVGKMLYPDPDWNQHTRVNFLMWLKGSLTRDFRLQVFFMNQCPFYFPGHWWRRWWDSQRPWERGCRWARRDLSYTCPAVWPPSSPNIWDRFRFDYKVKWLSLEIAMSCLLLISWKEYSMDTIL